MLWAKCGLQATSCLGLVGQSGVTIVCLAPSFSGNPPPHPIYVAAVEKPHVLTKFMASSPIISWQIGGKTETVIDFILGGSKITADGDCSHEIKRYLLLGRNAMANLVWPLITFT